MKKLLNLFFVIILIFSTVPSVVAYEDETKMNNIYDFDTPDTTPELNIIKKTDNASVNVEIDETTGSKALKVVRPAKEEVEFSIPLPKVDSDIVVVRYKIRIENLSSENQTKWSNCLISDPNKRIPSVKDSHGNDIVYMNAYYNRPKLNNKAEIQFKDTNCDLYADFSHVIDFSNKKTSSIITLETQKVIANDYDFANSDASDIDCLFFWLSGYTANPSDLILWIDDVSIQSLENLEPVSVTPADGATEVSPKTQVVLNYGIPVTQGFADSRNIFLRKGDEIISPDNYNVTVSESKITISFNNSLDYAADYTFSVGGKEYSFTTRLSMINKLYDFETDETTPEINVINSSGNASINVVTDETTNSKALRISRPSKEKLEFSINLPEASSDYVVVKYKIRIEELAKWYSGMISETGKSIPAIRDSNNLEAVYMSSYYNRPKVNDTVGTEVQFNESEKDKYRTFEYTLNFKNKTVICDVDYGNQVKLGNELSFKKTAAANVQNIYFYLGSVDSDLIMWIDDIEIKEINEILPISLSPSDGATNVSNKQEIAVVFDARVGEKYVKSLSMSLYEDDRELVLDKDFKIFVSGKNVFISPIDKWAYGGHYIFTLMDQTIHFATADWVKNKDTLYDFETDETTPEIDIINKTKDATIAIETDESTKSKALKVVRPRGNRAEFSFVIPKIAAKNVSVSFKMKVEKLEGESASWYSSQISDSNNPIPEIRDSENRRIAILPAYYNRPSLNSNGVSFEFKKNYDYAYFKYDLDFTKKMVNCYGEIAQTRGFAEYEFKNTDASDLNNIHFVFSEVTDDMILWIDDLKITEEYPDRYRFDNLKILNESGEEIQKISDAKGQKITLTGEMINEFSSEKNYLIIAEILDKENKLVGLDYSRGSMFRGKSDISLELNLPDNLENYEVKLLCWDQFLNSKRLCEPIYLK